MIMVLSPLKPEILALKSIMLPINLHARAMSKHYLFLQELHFHNIQLFHAKPPAFLGDLSLFLHQTICSVCDFPVVTIQIFMQAECLWQSQTLWPASKLCVHCPWSFSRSSMLAHFNSFKIKIIPALNHEVLTAPAVCNMHIDRLAKKKKNVDTSMHLLCPAEMYNLLNCDSSKERPGWVRLFYIWYSIWVSVLLH